MVTRWPFNTGAPSRQDRPSQRESCRRGRLDGLPALRPQGGFKAVPPARSGIPVWVEDARVPYRARVPTCTRWSSQDSVETLSKRLMSRFELLRTESERWLWRLQVLGCKAGPSSNSSQHPRSDFIVVVKGEYEVRPAVAGECLVRSGLSLDAPADAKKGRQDLSSLSGGPGAHAASNVTFRRSGGASSFSSRSAITRSARA